jgi:hypothetical protein
VVELRDLDSGLDVQASSEELDEAEVDCCG